MLAGGVGDDGALDGLSVDDDLLDTLLLSVGVDDYLVLGIAELAADGQWLAPHLLESVHQPPPLH